MISKTACAVVLLVGLSLTTGCSQTDTITWEQARDASVFSFDPAEFPGAKPWTSEDFKNSPNAFQFAILGDRHFLIGLSMSAVFA